MNRRPPLESLALASFLACVACGSAETVDPETVELCLERELHHPSPDVEVHIRTAQEGGEMGARTVRYVIGAEGYDDLDGLAAGLTGLDPAAACVRVVTHAEVRYGDVTPLLDQLIELGFVSIDLHTVAEGSAESS